jgi:peroxiredoxin
LSLLSPGQPFPELTITPVDAPAMTLPGDLAGRYAVVLFYRGAWCPYCNAQLRDFERSHDPLADLDIATVALSVDDEATTRELIAKHGLRFPVGHSADAAALAAATGAFTNPDPAYLQSTGFVLGPDGRVITDVYSSGAIGRLVAADVAGLVRYVREHAA